MISASKKHLKKAFIGIAAGLFALVALFGLAVYLTLFRPHVEKFEGSNYEEFLQSAGEESGRIGDLGIPHEAWDIHYVTSSVGLGGGACVLRFKAPVEEAQKFALANFKNYDRKPEGQEPTPEFVPISGRLSAPVLTNYGIRDLGWYDIENVSVGITLKRDHSHRPFTVIDTQRGVLYTSWTD